MSTKKYAASVGLGQWSKVCFSPVVQIQVLPGRVLLSEGPVWRHFWKRKSLRMVGECVKVLGKGW